uniref:Uncharacterized protein n=1 Tax=Aegilops tauschii subsp. strangulata TaxID=200361 RepID=A0A453NT86_AEGTS
TGGLVSHARWLGKLCSCPRGICQSPPPARQNPSRQPCSSRACAHSAPFSSPLPPSSPMAPPLFSPLALAASSPPPRRRPPSSSSPLSPSSSHGSSGQRRGAVDGGLSGWAMAAAADAQARIALAPISRGSCASPPSSPQLSRRFARPPLGPLLPLPPSRRSTR